ncbi:MAG: amino acid ABC transporter substrate-binding protein [Gemmatimonadetes bacterium]|nr:amino acid ABC transporter substrate-binding protein [Gemmatimonadota bacterium]
MSPTGPTMKLGSWPRHLILPTFAPASAALALASLCASLGCGALRGGCGQDSIDGVLGGVDGNPMALPAGDSVVDPFGGRGSGPGSRVPTVGAVLPLEGSPSMRERARLFGEGLEVGVELARARGVELELVVEDNRGTSSGSVRAAATLADRGVLAVLGPLDAGNLRAAVGAVPDYLPFFSPTAGHLPEARRGVYSLAAGDAEAGRALAATLWELGHRAAVVIHPSRARERIEVEAFRSTFESFGGTVRRRIEYSPGTTTFEAQLLEAKSLAPSLLVVAAPADDIRLLAPQIAFFGLDELGLQVAGTIGWSAPSVLEGLPTRHTEGVVALSTVSPGGCHEPPSEFVTAYESHFRRTLRSDIPAKGYDLLTIVLFAHAAGASRAAEVQSRLELIDEVPGVGATYTFSGGQLSRRYHPVRIEGGELRPLGRAPPACTRPSVEPPPDSGSSR